VGKVTGFLEYEREDRDYEPVEARIRHWREFIQPLPEADYRTQAARCMNCGVPYCQGTGSLMPGTPGCPVNNQIPDWNDLVYAGNWEEAARNLHSTNNFPEYTERAARRRAKPPALSTSTRTRSPSNRSSVPSPTAPSHRG